ncbi:hypothetical protein QSG27_09530, partial [Azospirillum sp. C340-1]|nr:hypothetical protein [Azospirillum isscasi]
ETPEAARSAVAPHGVGTAANGAGRDAMAASGSPHPSRMPARDTPLASSMMAKHTTPKQQPSTIGFAATAAPSGFRKAAVPPAPAAQPDAASGAANTDTATTAPATTPAATPAAGGTAANGNAFAPVTPDMLSETMMRNLAKYEQGRRAAHAPAPSLRVSG